MCANCGNPLTIGHWTEAGYASAHDRMRARFERNRLLKAVLAPYGLVAHDTVQTDGMVISTLNGQSEIADTLAALWACAQRLAGRPVDPFDPGLLGTASTPSEVQ